MFVYNAGGEDSADAQVYSAARQGLADHGKPLVTPTMPKAPPFGKFDGHCGYETSYPVAPPGYEAPARPTAAVTTDATATQMPSRRNASGFAVNDAYGRESPGHLTRRFVRQARAPGDNESGQYRPSREGIGWRVIDGPL